MLTFVLISGLSNRKPRETDSNPISTFIFCYPTPYTIMDENEETVAYVSGLLLQVRDERGASELMMTTVNREGHVNDGSE